MPLRDESTVLRAGAEDEFAGGGSGYSGGGGAASKRWNNSRY